MAEEQQRIVMLPIERAKKAFRLKSMGLINCSLNVFSSVGKSSTISTECPLTKSIYFLTLWTWLMFIRSFSDHSDDMLVLSPHSPLELDRRFVVWVPDFENDYQLSGMHNQRLSRLPVSARRREKRPLRNFYYIYKARSASVVCDEGHWAIRKSQTINMG